MLYSHFESMDSYLPVSLDNWNAVLTAFGVSLLFLVLRYFVLVGAFYVPFYFRKHSFPKLNPKLASKKQILFEVKWSMISSLIFAAFAVIMGVLWQKGYSKLYLALDDYGLWYLPVSFVLLSFVHELYFYVTHRWMHHPKIYKAIHAVHHKSIHTSPWASFSFHPGEAIVEAIVLPILICLIPVHPIVLLCYLTFMTLSAIINHLGFEVLGARWQRWLISGTHHSLHHTKFNGNYGLYFCALDKLLGTEIQIKGPQDSHKRRLETPSLG